MFTIENSEFSESEIPMLNMVLLEYIGHGVPENIRAQKEKSGQDLITNTWFDGITESQLRDSVLK